MQIVIDIPEDIYKSRDDEDYIRMCAEEISTAFRNGTVLPEHGRLIDADAIPYVRGKSDVCIPPFAYEYAIKEIPTILKAWGNEE